MNFQSYLLLRILDIISTKLIDGAYIVLLKNKKK